MSKKRQNTRYQHYLVGQYGEDRGIRIEAREPREAVRLWCEYQNDEFWRWSAAPVVLWTDDYHEPWSKFQRWIVDASQPPAWIIKPDQEDRDGQKS